MKHITLLELMELQKQGKAPIELFFEGHKYMSLDDLDYYCYDFDYDDDRHTLLGCYYKCYYLFDNPKSIGISPFILDSEEKEYLRNVIKPFRNEIKFIRKQLDGSKREYLTIHFKNDIMNFKSFKKDTRYKGMELYKEYTLEELGL